jgi:hypothetical protein
VAVAGRSHAAQMGGAVAANACLGRMEGESIAMMRVWGRTKSVPETAASRLLIDPGRRERSFSFSPRSCRPITTADGAKERDEQNI